MNSIKKIKKVDNLEFFTVSEESKKEVPFIEKRENKDPQFKINFNSPAINKKDNKFYTFLNSEL